MKTTIPEHQKEHRVFPRRASHGDAEIGLGLRKVQNLGAIHEHRRASLASKEPAMIHFTDMRNQIGFDPPRLLHDLRQTVE